MEDKDLLLAKAMLIHSAKMNAKERIHRIEMTIADNDNLVIEFKEKQGG